MRAMPHRLRSLPLLARLVSNSSALAAILLALFSFSAPAAVARTDVPPVRLFQPCSNEFASISPCQKTEKMTPNTSRTQSFAVTNNNGPGPLNFTVTCVKPSFVTSCTLSASNVNVQVGETSSFTVTYHVGTTTGSGNIAINITGPGADFGASIAVTLPVYAVTVTPKTATPVAIDTATLYTQSFTVYNAGTSSEVMDLIASCSQGIVICALDSSAVTLAANASKIVEL